ncbi:hypothetical protein C8R43DRAFT_1117400 [Mycena crocata]|nr:hypothetical protein C8R43DRAFT_1117400 [Mycena crocata]
MASRSSSPALSDTPSDLTDIDDGDSVESAVAALRLAEDAHKATLTVIDAHQTYWAAIEAKKQLMRSLAIEKEAEAAAIARRRAQEAAFNQEGAPTAPPAHLVVAATDGDQASGPTAPTHIAHAGSCPVYKWQPSFIQRQDFARYSHDLQREKVKEEEAKAKAEEAKAKAEEAKAKAEEDVLMEDSTNDGVLLDYPGTDYVDLDDIEDANDHLSFPAPVRRTLAGLRADPATDFSTLGQPARDMVGVISPGKQAADVPMPNAPLAMGMEGVISPGEQAADSVKLEQQVVPLGAVAGMATSQATEDVKEEQPTLLLEGTSTVSPLQVGPVPVPATAKLEGPNLYTIDQTAPDDLASPIPPPQVPGPMPPLVEEIKIENTKELLQTGPQAQIVLQPTLSGNKAGHLVKNWQTYSDTTKAAMQFDASVALAELLQHQLKHDGKCGRMKDHKKHAGYIRDIQEFCPESGRLSIQIFQEIHRTTVGNYVCGYHHLLAGPKLRLVDGNPGLSFKLNGHPAPYILAAKAPRIESDAVDTSDKVITIFHCGCEGEEAAIGFYIWKENTTLTKWVYGSAFRRDDGTLGRADKSFKKKITEGIGADRLSPHHRAFLVAMLKKQGFSLDVIYQGHLSQPEYQMKLVRMKMEYLLDEYEMAAQGCGRLEVGGSTRVQLLGAKETPKEDANDSKRAERKMKRRAGLFV